MGAAVVGGATYLFNQSTTEPEQPKSSASYLEEVSQACTEAAQNYLPRFSTQAYSMVRQYQEIAEKIINSDVSEKPLKLTTPSVAAITDVMGYPESRIRVGEDEIS